MKKLLVGLSLTLAALTLLTSPAMAETKADTKPQQAARELVPADRAFLAFLATLPPPAQTSTAAASPAKRRTGKPPMEKALCTATASCGDYNISCEGNSSTASCTAVDRDCPRRGYVTCDGVTTLCNETCPCPENFCDGDYDCASNCFPCEYTYTCNETYCTDRCRCHLSTCRW